jgi:hypothetical protein
MQTFGSRQFWPLDPRSAEIELVDIAHALSMQCRYAGHCLRFYSVAEHCVHVATWLMQQGYSADSALKGLLHDATEAYLVDVPRPVKPFLPGYREAEAKLWSVVCEWAELTDAMPAEVHAADNAILVDEMAQNMGPAPAPWSIPASGLGVTLQYWAPAEAEARYVELFNTLKRSVDLKRAA